MFSLLRAAPLPPDRTEARFEFDRDWSVRVMAVAPWCVRVLFTPPGGLREPRTWSVAPEGDVPWDGRSRADRPALGEAALDVRSDAGRTLIATQDLRAEIRLDPFGINWSDASGTVFAADRATQAYQASERLTTLRHWMTREPQRQYFGVGDKTGPLNLQGRRLRTLQMDALGYNGETSDPLYKHWPF